MQVGTLLAKCQLNMFSWRVFVALAGGWFKECRFFHVFPKARQHQLLRCRLRGARGASDAPGGVRAPAAAAPQPHAARFAAGSAERVAERDLVGGGGEGMEGPKYG